MKARHKRLALIGLGLGGIALIALLVFNAFRSNMVFFFSPTDVAQGKAPTGRAFRIGGLVKAGSVKRQPDGINVKFVVTDTAKSIPVVYQGILPDLFKEGKGVVAEGKLGADGLFTASQVLAKHDENYMPPEAAHALEQAQKAQETIVK